MLSQVFGKQILKRVNGRYLQRHLLSQLNGAHNDANESTLFQTDTDENDCDVNDYYGTQITVENSPLPHANDAPLSQFIRFGLNNNYLQQEVQRQEDEDGTYDNDDGSGNKNGDTTGGSSDFLITCLGTGSGSFSKTRSASCTALRVGSPPRIILFDVGEGVQRQLIFSKLLRRNMLQLKQIFITHLHGDHLFGLIGMLLKFQVSAKSNMEDSNKKGSNSSSHSTATTNEKRSTSPEKHVLEIYGPPGIYNYITMNLALTFSKMYHITIIVNELTGGRYDPRKIKKDKNDKRRNTHTSFYPEFRNPNVSRKTIPMNIDGTWTIETVDVGIDPPLSNHEMQNVSIMASEVSHLPGIQTFGYVVEEAPFERNIDADKAKECGIRPGPKFRLLKRGIPVKNDAKDPIMIQPDQVLTPNVVRPRKFALLGDNCAISQPMQRLIRNADVLVQEATIVRDKKSVGNNDTTKDAIKRGHSTPATSGKMACESNANVLLLNHISCSIQMKDVEKLVVQMAEKTNKGVSKVVASYDFMELNVPRGGFNFKKN